MCHRTVSTMAFTLLAFVFLISTLFVHYFFSPFLLFFVILLLAGATLYQTIDYLKKDLITACIPIDPDAVQTVMVVMLSALITFALCDLTGMSNVLASSLIGIIAGVFFKKYDLAAFTGSFVGMSSLALFDYPHLLMASVIAGVLFVSGKSAFPGIGGKLGSTAFVGTLLTSTVIHKTAFSFLEYGIDLWHIDFTMAFVIGLILFCAFASYLTHWLSNRFFKGSVVIGSGAVGLLGALLMPLFFKESAFLLATAIYCASFAGMSKTNALQSGRYFWLAGALSGLIFFTTTPIFIGLGGKLGTSAFLATLGTKTLQEASLLLKRRLQNG